MSPSGAAEAGLVGGLAEDAAHALVGELVDLGEFVEAEEGEAAAGIAADVVLAVEVAEPERGAARGPGKRQVRVPHVQPAFCLANQSSRQRDQAAGMLELSQRRSYEQGVVTRHVV